MQLWQTLHSLETMRLVWLGWHDPASTRLLLWAIIGFLVGWGGIWRIGDLVGLGKIGDKIGQGPSLEHPE